MAKPRKTGKKYKPKITLYPLTIEEALKKAMETKLPKKPTKKPSLSQIQGRPGAGGGGRGMDELMRVIEHAFYKAAAIAGCPECTCQHCKADARIIRDKAKEILEAHDHAPRQ